MFRKILIANRGEIACRVMQTSRRLGIDNIAIYSDIDMKSKHVQMADRAYYVGGNKSSDSYLQMNKIINIAKESGAEAIHPGYGFLSENCEFVNLCEKNGIKFIGPNSYSIRAMGSKIESKKIMSEANVPLVPGYYGDNQEKDFLIEQARKIQYPIMIKADLGGGGKGMRIVNNENEFFEALQSCQNESSKSFGSAKILLERYVKNSRHIEVQVFGDNYDNHVYLFERDCTIQRRHQKVVEEAPSSLSEELRKSLGESAVKAAKAVKYVNAGTVEFIFDIDRQEFYFMEMNTRLQVEHPISEMITRQDFVEWQLKVAAGYELPLKQHEIKRYGHAIECRVYSEDPYNGFLPGSGKITYLREPNHRDSKDNSQRDENVRVETGIRQGDEVSIFYDPMISKLVCWAETRDLAIKKTINALEHYKVLGLPTNIGFLQTILKHKKFQEWDFDTNFIGTYKEDLLKESNKITNEDILATVLSKISPISNNNNNESKTKNPWNIRDSFRVNYKEVSKYKLIHHFTKEHITIHVRHLDLNCFNVSIFRQEKAEHVYEHVRVKNKGDEIELNVEKKEIMKFQVIN